MTAALVAPELRPQLDRLALRLRTRVTGRYTGGHRSRRLGASLDFADYREYVPGDDLRRVDYAIYARLGKLLVRQYEAEEEAPVRVLVDSSASMAGVKWEAVCDIAGIVAYLALVRRERVQLVSFGSTTARGSIAVSPWFAGPEAEYAAAAWLRARESGGSTPIAAAVSRVLSQPFARGLTAVVSDFLTREWPRALGNVPARGAQGLAVHVLAPDELDPELAGDLTLVDAESGAEVGVSATPQALSAYRDRLRTFREDVARRARRAGMDYVFVPATPDAATILVDGLLASGLGGIGGVA